MSASPGVKAGGREPRDTQLREFDGVGDGGALLRGDGGVVTSTGSTGGPAGWGRNILSSERLQLSASKSPAMAMLALLGV